MSEPILVAQDLIKSYGVIKAVDGISLQVARGEIFGLLGPNGAGKTTAISMPTALFPPDSGSITVDGLDLAKETNTVKSKMGLVPQELALYPTLSARQNLMFFGRIYDLKGQQLRDRVHEILDLVGLLDRAGDAVEKYSGGMKRRVNTGGGIILLGVRGENVETTTDQIAGLPAAKAATRSDGQLKIETHNIQEALIGALDITNRLDVSLISLELLEPNLESVFLHMTGKKLRQ